ncbi:solanesyl-diphosphate synthase 1, mitochondrial isoform X1 [Panicum miliaceum]|uniref:Solanesyl-diphosphate synthase 1, mitochondrial isoform X1 n=1 Tax=Panicum miliaceum TaxID=4540 RepID=A0A3L6T0G1_PANMI|nr:solanesyl-diphosphate synthase 1, mitochondrial isoform X1 [Panicum miliaceum]
MVTAPLLAGALCWRPRGLAARLGIRLLHSERGVEPGDGSVWPRATGGHCYLLAAGVASSTTGSGGLITSPVASVGSGASRRRAGLWSKAGGTAKAQMLLTTLFSAGAALLGCQHLPLASQIRSKVVGCRGAAFVCSRWLHDVQYQVCQDGLFKVMFLTS